MTQRLPSQRIAAKPLHTAIETIPAAPGAYVLLITLPIAVEAPWSLPAGRYLYCGSARGPGGMRARIARHMRPHKTIRWHIDHLTTCGAATGAWAFPDGDECVLAHALSHLPVPVPGFGSSDCAQCRSHLFRWPQDQNSVRRCDGFEKLDAMSDR